MGSDSATKLVDPQISIGMGSSSNQPDIVISSSHCCSDNKTQNDDDQEVTSLQKSLEMINNGSKSLDLAELKNLLDSLYHFSNNLLLERADKFDSFSYQKAKICQQILEQTLWNKNYMIPLMMSNQVVSSFQSAQNSFQQNVLHHRQDKTQQQQQPEEQNFAKSDVEYIQYSDSDDRPKWGN